MKHTETRLVGLFGQTYLLRFKDLEQSGLKRMEISRLVASGELWRLWRGFYDGLPLCSQN